MNKFNIFIQILISPVQLVLIPTVFLKSLFHFFKDKNFNAMGFDMLSALNNYFYKTQKLNIDIFSKNKASNLLGFGNYHLSRLFYIPRLSHNFFINLGPALSTVLFTFLNLLMCTIFYETSNSSWVIMVIFFAYFSSVNYAATFTGQNYNLLGWLFFPIFLFSLANNETNLLLISILVIFILSFAVGLYIILYTLIYCLFIDISFYYLALPFSFLILGYIIPLIKSGLLKKWIIETFLFMGISNRNRYSRSHQRFSKFNIYYTILFSVPILFGLLKESTNFFLIYIPFTIFILNQFLFRLMDRENPIYAYFLCSIIFTIYNPQIIYLLSFVLIINPHPETLNVALKNNGMLFNLRVFKSFNKFNLINSIKKFTEKVQKKQVVLFAYNNPNKNYDKIFDGYRYVIEAIYYHFQERKIRSFPDWYSIWEENNNKKIFWGRNYQTIFKNLKKLKSNFLVYYSDQKKIKDLSILKNFKILSNFSMKRDYFDENSLWNNKNKIVYFYLLEKK